MATALEEEQEEFENNTRNMLPEDIITRNIFEELSKSVPSISLVAALDGRGLCENDENPVFFNYDQYTTFLQGIQSNLASTYYPSLLVQNFLSLSPSSFLSLPRNEREHVKETTLVYYCNKKLLAVRYLLKLVFFYCDDRNGTISEASFQSFIENEIIMASPTLLKKFSSSFFPYYACTVSRKVFFFLDVPKRGFIKLQSLASNPLFLELLEIDSNQTAVENEQNGVSRWFSAENALFLYEKYLELDLDGNGMLSKKELSGFGNGTLTDTFLSRFFEECVSYKSENSSEDEIDYRMYLDLVLILTNISSKPALNALFRILDSRGNGILNVFDLDFFYKGLKSSLDRMGFEAPPLEHLVSEIFDMVHPRNGWEITMKDLERCGCCGTVIGILIDATVFIEYENREAVTGVDDDELEREPSGFEGEEVEAAISVL
eukprot:jgi/Galph1/2262/GphlegSOOS_G936.1